MPSRPRLCHASSAGRAARTTCRSTESVRSRSGNSAPAAPPMTVIEFIRWSVSFATSNSRHGVCFDSSSLAIPCRTRSSTANVSSALSSSSVGGESGPDGKSAGMRPTLRRGTAYRCRDEDARFGGRSRADPRRADRRLRAHHAGHRRDDPQPGPPINSPSTKTPTTVPGLPGIPIPDIPVPGFPGTPMSRWFPHRRTH